MAELNMDRVVEILHDTYGLTSAYVEQTGGGCATIYAGNRYVDDDQGHTWAAVAGPGGWTPGGWLAPGAVATGDTGDFYIGFDDMGQTVPYATGDDDTEATVAARIAETVAVSHLIHTLCGTTAVPALI